MSFCVKQRAWLNAPVNVPDNSKRKPEARIVQFLAEGTALELPDNPLPYMTDWLFEIGPSVPTGMGSVALNWGNLAEWQQFSGVTLDYWEAKTLRKLSEDWVAQIEISRDPDCRAPCPVSINEDDAVADAFDRMFAARRKERP